MGRLLVTASIVEVIWKTLSPCISLSLGQGEGDTEGAGFWDRFRTTIDAVTSSRPIQEVLQEHTRALMAIPGVEGVAQGERDGQPCIRVFVSHRTKDMARRVPSSLEGYPVEITESGKLRAR